MSKRIWAMTIKRTLLSVGVAFVAGMIFERLFGNAYGESEAFQAGFIAVAVYAAAGIGLALINLASGALYLWWFADKEMTETILEEFRALKMPPPGQYASKSFAYLAELADDKYADPDDRVKAAFMHGTYKAIMAKGLFRSLAVGKALDNAILRYAQEAPARRPVEDDED